MCKRRTRRLAAVAALASIVAGGSACESAGFGAAAGRPSDAVLALLGIAEADRVAELTAGDAATAFALARAVGAAGRVYAVVDDPDRVTTIGERAERDGVANLVAVLGDAKDPHLPDGEIDLALLSGDGVGIPDRVAYFGNLLRDLAPNGRVAIVGVDDEGTERWMRRAGYRLLERHPLPTERSLQIFGAEDETGE